MADYFLFFFVFVEIPKGTGKNGVRRCWKLYLLTKYFKETAIFLSAFYSWDDKTLKYLQNIYIPENFARRYLLNEVVSIALYLQWEYTYISEDHLFEFFVSQEPFSVNGTMNSVLIGEQNYFPANNAKRSVNASPNFIAPGHAKIVSFHTKSEMGTRDVTPPLEYR